LVESADKKQKEPNKFMSLRKYSTQTNFRMVLWFIFLIIFIGLGLVWIFYGKSAALLGLLCLAGAGIPVGLIALSIFGLDTFIKKQ
jgi:hypothetical protein